MLLRQKIAMILICVFVFVFILELVRRRKLREEYSWLWLLTSILMFLMVIQYEWLTAISRIIGAVIPTTALFIGALLFLMILSVQFSVRISSLSDQVKNIMQDNALLKAKIEQLTEKSQATNAPQ